MRSVILFFAFICCHAQGLAQLPNGSYAPDFVATDIYGEEYRLYDLLNEGKKVILDISATWCSPCWDYHQSGALDELFESYGPGGTDEYFVFLIEGDLATDLDDLYGTGNNTLGDWTANTHYPIIDSREIAELYKINFFPTLYMICPNRKVYNLSQVSAQEIVSTQTVCPPVLDGVNISLINYEGFEGKFCNRVHFNPGVSFQNLGTETLTDVSAQLMIQGNLVQEIIWTGNLSTYEVATVVFDELEIFEDVELHIELDPLDDILDVDESDNNYAAHIEVAPVTEQPLLELELFLDNFPHQIYWEIADENDDRLYFGGNEQVVLDTAEPTGAYTSSGLVTIPIALPSSMCYSFRIYDSFGNGLGDNGYYRLLDHDGNELISNQIFDFEDERSFGLVNHEGIAHNIAITRFDPLPYDFCKSFTLNQNIDIINLGNAPVQDILFKLGLVNGIQFEFPWLGELAPGEMSSVEMPAFNISQDQDFFVQVLEVNGEEDSYEYKNGFELGSIKRSTNVRHWIVDITTDAAGYELYWELTNDEEEVLLKGGNELVGAQGGGLGIASPDDAGAYGNNKHYEEEITLPESGCYKLTILDDGGNGFFPGGFGIPDPFVRIRNSSVGIISGTDGDFNDLFETNIELDINTGTTDTNPLEIKVIPNPANEEVYIQTSDTDVNGLSIYSCTGEKVLEQHVFGNVQISVKHLPAGLYWIELRFSSKLQRNMTKLVIAR